MASPEIFAPAAAPGGTPHEQHHAAGLLRATVLKQGDTFLVSNGQGDVEGGADGMFCDDTRILSLLSLRLGDQVPWLLGSSVSNDNVFFTATLTNHPLPPLGGRSLPEGVIHIERKRLLWANRLYERIRLVNFSISEAAVPVSIRFAADFADIFEVRGQRRAARGNLAPPAMVDGQTIRLSYTGRDELQRSTVLSFAPAPKLLGGGGAEFLIQVPHVGCADIYLEIGGEAGADRPSLLRFRRAAARARWAARARRTAVARPRTTNRLFNEWLERSEVDLALLTTDLPTGPYPYAGVPWFSTPFGRDGIITALQTLWLAPDLARGVLRFLAGTQAQQSSSFQDAAPGKIMHETRKGEMAVLQEVPFAQYYGGVDATPLFVVLAGAYADRTGDLALIEELWPALTQAMGWVTGAGDSNGDGFIDYARGEASGLANQGWKDSQDSIFHANGQFPEGPIALVEVQGYAYAAFRAMAKLSALRGEAGAAPQWAARAETLRRAVERHFWIEEAGFYGIALDGAGALCAVRASNAGHLLFSGLPTPDRAARVAAQLMTRTFRTGWGIRTLAATEARFNPMSYHNGSVWPHDTALCAAGLAAYGWRDAACALLTELFDAAICFGMRLPELFCGFERAAGEPPVPYPVACLPQAWAAGSAFMALQACLGLTIDGIGKEIVLDRPRLPAGVDGVTLRNLAIGEQHVNLTIERTGGRIAGFVEGAERTRISVRDEA